MILRIAAAVLALGLLVPTVRAAEAVVWFVDGRTMVVESVTYEGDLAVLRLEGGSRFSVPASRIDRFHAAAAKPAPASPPVAVPAESWSAAAGPFAEMIRGAAHRHGLDPALLVAMAEAESNFDPRAISHKGAEGLLQLMPATARRFGVRDSFDPGQNVEGGAQYLKWLLQRFAGDESLALAGYNAGEGAVDRYDGVPPFPETEQYVAKVLGRAESFRVPPVSAR